MELFLKNGDYLPDGQGGFVRATGGEELLQRVLFQLTAHRGAFPLLPQLGSRIYTLPRYKQSQWESLARLYVAEALENESELTVTNVTVTPIRSGAQIDVDLDYLGDALTITLNVTESGGL